jgi:outer membrane murein-binding lipoprotein Lpp
MAVRFQLARRRMPIAVVVVSGVLAIAGCGSASKPPGASNSATTSSSARKRPSSPSSFARSQLAAAKCIRSHGVPNFPDPTFGAGGAQVNLSTPPGMLTSPGFELAQTACARRGLELAGYAPTSTATTAEMAQALTTAKCMRAHGVPNWPDPSRNMPSNANNYNVQGAAPGPAGGPIFLIPKSINIQAPAVKQAATACHDT